MPTTARGRRLAAASIADKFIRIKIIAFIADGAIATAAVIAPVALAASAVSVASADVRPSVSGPLTLAAQAESKLAPTLAKPVVDSSPAAGLAQVVQLPTWTWLPEAQWTAITATASSAGKSVTVTATPVEVAFSWGDGTTSVCQGAGTPYVAGVSDASAPSPTCGHTYQVTSAGQPDQQFPVIATLSWKIAWSGEGKSGTFPDLATSTTVRWTVEQVESVLVGGGVA